MTDLRLSRPAQPGEVLDGRYRLEELVGEGGMGSVWRASDDALGRTVAVKVFWAGATDDSDAVRRESEKRLLASLSHPSLVTLFDAQLSPDTRSYLVMEYIDGGTLASLMTRGSVAPPDAASLAADLGEALHVVHAAGIIHRDVKPANILLRPPLTPNHTFRAVLADFGIAYLVDSARVTTPGTAIGTAAYISPEQVRGHAPTPASDIYSLGLVLLEALSGRRAFAQQTPVEAISVRLSTPPDIPGDWGYGWRSLLTAMTAIDPQERPSPLEVSARGRELDVGEMDPGTTGLVSPAVAQPVMDVRTADATKVLPAIPPPPPPVPERPPSMAPTALLTGTAVDEEAKTAAPRDPDRRRRRRWAIILTAVGVGVVALVASLTLWSGLAAAPDPATELPQLEEPLGTHIQELMEEVSP
ncbi:MAG: serine/threonine-protein kinase [Microbacterium sp.]